MKRVDEILKHPLFLKTLSKITVLEKDRIFCGHGLEHLLDVARIGCIINIKESYSLNDEYIYVAALLHDLGRVEQYESGIPHEQAAVPVAEKIMKECGFSNNEIILITEAILSHREDNAQKKDLGALLYKADKASRLCFVCNAADKCNWADDKKNKNIIY